MGEAEVTWWENNPSLSYRFPLCIIVVIFHRLFHETPYPLPRQQRMLRKPCCLVQSIAMTSGSNTMMLHSIWKRCSFGTTTVFVSILSFSRNIGQMSHLTTLEIDLVFGECKPIMEILLYTCLGGVWLDQWEQLIGNSLFLEFCQLWVGTVGLIITGWTSQQLWYLAHMLKSMQCRLWWCHIVQVPIFQYLVIA